MVLNEIDVASATLADCRVLVSEETDFFGEVVNFRRKTSRVREKTPEKLRELWHLRDTWSWKQAVGAIITALWCAPVLAIDLSKHYRTLAALRMAGRLLQRDPSLWDSPAILRPEFFGDFSTVVAIVCLNADTPIARALSFTDTTHTIITDASAWGWGAFCIRHSDWTVVDAQAPWGGSLAGNEQSTTAEPEAIWRAACRFLSPNEHAVVMIVTDHSPWVDVVRRGYSASALNNGVLRRLKERFPRAVFEARHVAGINNPADTISRVWGPASPPAADRALHLAMHSEPGGIMGERDKAGATLTHITKPQSGSHVAHLADPSEPRSHI